MSLHKEILCEIVHNNAPKTTQSWVSKSCFLKHLQGAWRRHTWTKSHPGASGRNSELPVSGDNHVGQQRGWGRLGSNGRWSWPGPHSVRVWRRQACACILHTSGDETLRMQGTPSLYTLCAASSAPPRPKRGGGKPPERRDWSWGATLLQVQE